MIETIQKMHHHLCTAFGDSDSSYGPNPPGPPPQGILQGNGTGPVTWTAVTTVLVKCMQSEDFGFDVWSMVSQRVMSLV